MVLFGRQSGGRRAKLTFLTLKICCFVKFLVLHVPSLLTHTYTVPSSKLKQINHECLKPKKNEEEEVGKKEEEGKD